MPAPYGVYIHVPWCRTRCAYCAFAVSTDAPRWDRWADGVVNEWSARRTAFPGHANTLYFGGGTPSLAPTESLARLVQAIPLQPGAEITIEVNPGDLSQPRLDAWRDIGIHRFSLGVQTFSPRLARLLSRRHTVHEARALTAMVRASEPSSWSVDIIFGVPGQTPDDFEQDLQAILETSPPHVSLYGLTFEPGTPLTRARDAGRIQAPNDDQWRAMYDRAVDVLGHAGLHRYEVSNFARDGHRSQHNEGTWRAGYYAGLGPSAHGFAPSGIRTRNHTSVDEWLADIAGVTEHPTREEAAVDLILSSLRHVDGLDLGLLHRRCRMRPAPAVVNAIATGGALEIVHNHLGLTVEGFPVADGIVSRLCRSLLPSG